MSLVPLVGEGFWYPGLPGGYYRVPQTLAVSYVVLDADEEEGQLIGPVHIDGGGTHTFGTAGSALAWKVGNPITFLAGSTVRVGVKNAARLSVSAGPVARATLGASAFDVYTDLVGGVDTLTPAAWRMDAMAAGTPFSLTDGDMVALCWHVETTSGSPAVRVECGALTNALGLPVVAGVTSGPTHTEQAAVANCILTFDDGTLGWLLPSKVYSIFDVVSTAIGATNIFGNIFRVPFPCAIDAVWANVFPSTGAADFSINLYSTPLETPALLEAIPFDANQTGIMTPGRPVSKKLASPRTLTPHTDYLIGVRQTTATALAVFQVEVADAAHLKALGGMGPECYAASSVAGATFAPVLVGGTARRRFQVSMRISHLDNGVSAGGGSGVRAGVRRRGIGVA